MTTMVDESCHPIFTQDPAHWMQYIYKKVRVLTGPNQEHVGHVYTVDPVTSSFILVHFPPAAVSDTSNLIETSSSSATTPNTTTASDTTVTEVKSSDTSIATATTTTITSISATSCSASTPKTGVGVSVIPGHAVVDVVVLQKDDNDADDSSSGNGPKDSDYENIKARLDALFLNSRNTHLSFDDIEANHLSEEALLERKDKLKSWLLKNRLPVQEQKGQDKGKFLCVAGAVTILPPYGPSNCCSTNEIILSRIQNLIRNMPATV